MLKVFLKKIATPTITLVYIFTVLFGSIPFSYAEETTYFFLNDHLGSVDVVLDMEGNVVERADYMPFGDDRLRVNDGENSDNYKFTGQELDSETGLYYYEARYYDPVIGRFITEDNWEGDLMNPQTFNKYSYTVNNPVNNIDPSGNIVESLWDAAWTAYDTGRVAVNVIQNAANGYIYAYASVTGNTELQDETVQSINKNWSELKDASIDTTIDAGATLIPAVPAIAGPTRATKKTIDTINKVENSYSIAKNGGNHSGFLQNYINKSVGEIKKGINSFKKQIVKHKNKIQNPTKHVDNWKNLNNFEKNGLKRKWQKDITRQKEQKSILEGIIKEE